MSLPLACYRVSRLLFCESSDFLFVSCPSPSSLDIGSQILVLELASGHGSVNLSLLYRMCFQSLVIGSIV